MPTPIQPIQRAPECLTPAASASLAAPTASAAPVAPEEREASLAAADVAVWSRVEALHAESFGWARSCCRQDREEAENVVQAVYLKILERKAVFDGRASLRTWLFAVIRRTAAERRRRSLLRHLAFARRQHELTAQAPPHNPEESAYLGEMRSTFRRLVARLPRRQSEVLQLVFYHDLSLAEAAAVMEVSVGSARTHYDRGKRRLREALREARTR